MNDENIFNFTIFNERKFENKNERTKVFEIYKNKILDNNAPEIIFNDNDEFEQTYSKIDDKDDKKENNEIGSTHTKGSGNYLCLMCFKFYVRKENLNRHIEKIHSINVRNYDILKCNYEGCTSSVSSRKSLKEHMNSHYVQDLNCKYCLKTFISKKGITIDLIEGLILHERKFHIVNLPYKCESNFFIILVCKKRFVCKSRLNQHKCEYIISK